MGCLTNYTPWYRFRRALVAVPLLWSGPTPGGEVERVDVERDRGRFYVEVTMLVEADPAQVQHLLTDYDHLDRIHPAVRFSRRLATEPDGSSRVEVHSRKCLLWICRDLVQIQRVRGTANGILRVEDLPGGQGLASASTHWEIRAHGDRTRLNYRSEFMPDFWLPPVIGPMVVERDLREGARITIRNLEHLARRSNPAASEHSDF